MDKYIKYFNTHQAYEDYIYSPNALFPNVSYCADTGHVHYNPVAPPDPRVIATFNVTNTSSNTTILTNVNNVSEIEIDGVVQQGRPTSYRFTTKGEHTVKYRLTDQTQIGQNFMWYLEKVVGVTIPVGVTTIGSNAFMSCYELTSVTMSNTVTTIGERAFQSSGVKDIVWSNNLTTIGQNAFPLTNLGQSTNGVVTIPNSVTTIGERAFQRLDYMTQMYVGENVTSIGDNAFGTNSGMTSFTINALTPPTIGSELFYSHGQNFIIYVPAASVDAYKAATNWSTYASRIQAIQ